MCRAQGPQHSDTSEAQTRGPLVSSQALYHRATVLPIRLDLSPNCLQRFSADTSMFLGLNKMYQANENVSGKAIKVWL